MNAIDKELDLLEKCYHLLDRIDSFLYSINGNIIACLDILEKHDDECITFDKLDK